MNWRRQGVAALGLLLFVAACGEGNGRTEGTSGTLPDVTEPDSSGPTSSTVPSSTVPSSTVTELRITIGTDDEPVIKTATLVLVDAADNLAGSATGTGFLADPERAGAAAALFENPEAVRRLVDGPPVDRMCTMIYGGPDRATIEGVWRGSAVSQSFHRADGCGIADWELFGPLLGRSHWDGEHRIFLEDETDVAVAVGTTFTVELASNATTGYAWQPSVAPAGVLRAGQHEYLDPGSDLVGAGGWERFRYTATSTGTATITFEYRRPWEGATTPPGGTAVFTVTVTG